MHSQGCLQVSLSRGSMTAVGHSGWLYEQLELGRCFRWWRNVQDGMVKRHNHLKIGQYHQHLMELLDPEATPLQCEPSMPLPALCLQSLSSRSCHADTVCVFLNVLCVRRYMLAKFPEIPLVRRALSCGRAQQIAARCH